MFPDVHAGEALVTWLVFSVPGLCAWPLIRRAFPNLPDGGYAIARPVGLVLLTWGCWVAPSITPLPYSTVWVWVVAGALLVGGTYIAVRDRGALRSHLKHALIAEAVFTGFFIVLLAVMPYNAQVMPLQERFMDYAYMNRLQHTTSFPPLDMWMAGKTVQYYYYGYVMMDVLRRLSGIELVRFFSYALVGVYASFTTAAYGAGLAVSKRRTLALATVAIAMLGGNLHVWVEWIAKGDFDKISWFHAARVIDGTITEFPLFQWTFGDLHPHVLAFPLGMTAIALTAACLHHPAPLGRSAGVQPAEDREKLGWRALIRETLRALRRTPPPWKRALSVGLLVALVVGALFPTNSWDYPTFGAAVFGAIFLSTVLATPAAAWPDRLAAGLWVAGIAGVLSVLAYLPFNLSFGATQGGRGILFATRRSDVHQFLIHWAPLLLMVALYLWVSRSKKMRMWLVACAVLIVAVGAFELGLRPTLLESTKNLPTVAFAILHYVLFAGHAWFIVAILLWVLVREYPWMKIGQPRYTAVAAVALALLILLGVELVFLSDHYRGGELHRMNTVFKAYLQVWMLLAAAVPVLVWYALAALGKTGRWIAGALVVVCGVSMAGYLGIGTTLRYNRFERSTTAGEPNMNADAYFRRHPATRRDGPAIDWITQNVPPDAVVAEATENAYRWVPRVSTFTGRISIIGWVNHEAGWRNSWKEPQQRRDDIEELYTTDSLERALQICRKYDVDYVYRGWMESRLYRSREGAAKFDKWETVYDKNGVRIYAVPK